MFKKFVRRSLLGLILLSLLCGGAVYIVLYHGLYAPLPVSAADKYYTVRKGMSLSQVARELAAQDVLSYPAAVGMVVYARATRQSHKLKAGEYKVPPAINAQQLLQVFIEGKAVLHGFTIVEGWNFKQLMQAMHEASKLKHTLKGMSGEEIMARLGVSEVHPEGRFYPDTYHFNQDTEDLTLLKQAYEKMQSELKEAWERRDKNLPLKNAEEALVLASIIEKETGATQERAKIGGVFTQRLRRQMRLQTDPTVIYGLGDNYDGNLRSADLQRDTPYNSYTREGLPPTPIAMPGRDALNAAVQPDESGKLYFVAKGDGTHYFSANLAEHHCAVIRYQLKHKAPSRYRSECRKHPSCTVCRES